MAEQETSGKAGDDYFVPSPDDPDYDLSEAAGYAGWEPRRSFALSRGVVIVISVLLILALVLPVILRVS